MKRYQRLFVCVSLPDCDGLQRPATLNETARWQGPTVTSTCIARNLKNTIILSEESQTQLLESIRPLQEVERFSPLMRKNDLEDPTLHAAVSTFSLPTAGHKTLSAHRFLVATEPEDPCFY